MSSMKNCLILSAVALGMTLSSSVYSFGETPGKRDGFSWGSAASSRLSPRSSASTRASDKRDRFSSVRAAHARAKENGTFDRLRDKMDRCSRASSSTGASAPVTSWGTAPAPSASRFSALPANPTAAQKKRYNAAVSRKLGNPGVLLVDSKTGLASVKSNDDFRGRAIERRRAKKSAERREAAKAARFSSTVDAVCSGETKLSELELSPSDKNYVKAQVRKKKDERSLDAWIERNNEAGWR